ncbi:ATP-dependent DNA helicase PIF7-like [Anopheles merus]|uniref:ATP-dependent DNA helicase PIF7-like n=1 Tax=Anopheles merus TaxID=30066 RepID=UPI001BE447E1|nr:ATP-dependent DNA helicase PIF7-like [Anopheles merus]
MWVIFGFEMQAKTVTVVQLPIHLEHQHRFMFQPNENVNSVLERGHHTILTRFFQLAANDPGARNLTYQEVPIYYRFDKPTHRLPWYNGPGMQWVSRIREFCIVVGRMVYCSMSQMERYCLRLLLCYRKGPTSFEDLRTVDGTVFASYQEAATMAGLFQDDLEWDRAMQEAVTFQMPSQLRNLFAVILSQELAQNPRRLWDTYVDHLCEDFHWQHRDRYTSEESDQNRILRALEQAQALRLIEKYLRESTPSKTLTSISGMPQLADFHHFIPIDQLLSDQTSVNIHIDAERSYSINTLDETLASLHLLNVEQRLVYDVVTAVVDRHESEFEGLPEEHRNLFFLDGPGGTGKSFLLEKILAYTRRQSKIALAAASSGIAALLLTGGKTVHSTFKLPLALDENSTCNIPVQSSLANLMRQAALIVWDEASMSSRYALEAVDRTLQDIVGVHRPFGGKVLLLCGDFRQILPIVPKGTDAQVIQQCLKKSALWEQFKVLRLHVNMRVQTASTARSANDLQNFTDFLLRIGEGRHATFPGLDASFAKIPRDMVLPRSASVDDNVRILINRVFPDIRQYFEHLKYFTDRAILSPKNVDVTAINNCVLEQLPGPVQEYLSVDALVNPEEHETLQIPPEFLHSINLSGIPVHCLRLKKYTPVLLLRNLNTERGLCNGTRLLVIEMKPHCIHARILTGKRQGDDVLLPRILCDSNDANILFQICRKQFPIQVCFAMTINKAQAQIASSYFIADLGLFNEKSFRYTD